MNGHPWHGIIRDGVIEAWTNAVVVSRLSADDRVVNVGANFGSYSVLAAQTVGRMDAVAVTRRGRGRAPPAP